MKEKFSKLIDVKSIITISLTILFIILAIKGSIEANAVIQIFSTVIAFYFGVKQGKKENTKEEDTKDDKFSN